MRWLNKHIEAIMVAVVMSVMIATAMYIQHQGDHIHKLKRQLYYAKLKVTTVKANSALEIQALKNQVVLLKEQVAVEKAVVEELNNTEEEFTILASKGESDENSTLPKHNCHWDGTGYRLW